MNVSGTRSKTEPPATDKDAIKALLLAAFPECTSQEQAIKAFKEWGDVSKGTWYRWLNGETPMPQIARRALEGKAKLERLKARVTGHNPTDLPGSKRKRP